MSASAGTSYGTDDELTATFDEQFDQCSETDIDNTSPPTTGGGTCTYTFYCY